jgi:hypothetical protein
MAGWLRQIANTYHQPIVTMARLLRTSPAMQAEIARLLNEAASIEARQLVTQEAKPPTERDIYSELVRRYHAALMAIKRREANAHASQQLAAMARREAKEERRKKEGNR